MKDSTINIKTTRRKITIRGSTDQIQVSIDGKTKSLSRDKLSSYRKGTEKTYPKVQDDIDSIEVDKVYIHSDIVGVISDVFVEQGQFVRKDDLLLSISAMKVENEIASPIDGKVAEIFIKKNQKIEENKKLMLIKR